MRKTRPSSAALAARLVLGLAASIPATLMARVPDTPAPLEDEASVERAAVRLAEELGVANVLITRGPGGMLLARSDGAAAVSLAARATELVDELEAGWPSMVTPELGLGGVEPGEAEIRERMSGNLCRCGAYANIVPAIAAVAK